MHVPQLWRELHEGAAMVVLLSSGKSSDPRLGGGLPSFLVWARVRQSCFKVRLLSKATDFDHGRTDPPIERDLERRLNVTLRPNMRAIHAKNETTPCFPLFLAQCTRYR